VEHRIRTNPILAVILLCASLFILGVSALTGPSLNTITGALLLVLGILQLTVPTIVIVDGEIQHRNLFGMTLRRTPFTLDTLDVREATPKISGEPVRGFSSWALERAAVERFRDDIRARQAAASSTERDAVRS
jgi:hypothetical protein